MRTREKAAVPMRTLTPNKMAHIEAVTKCLYDVAKSLGWTELAARDLALLGFVHDFGYHFEGEPHSRSGSDVLENAGYAHAWEVEMHGRPTEEPTTELMLLWHADLSCSHDGRRCTYAERLRGIEEHYGADSVQARNAKTIMERLRKTVAQRLPANETWATLPETQEKEGGHMGERTERSPLAKLTKEHLTTKGKGQRLLLNDRDVVDGVKRRLEWLARKYVTWPTKSQDVTYVPDYGNSAATDEDKAKVTALSHTLRHLDMMLHDNPLQMHFEVQESQLVVEATVRQELGTDTITRSCRIPMELVVPSKRDVDETIRAMLASARPC